MTSDVAGTSRLRDDIESLHEEARQITGGLGSPTIKPSERVMRTKIASRAALAACRAADQRLDHATEHDAVYAEGYATTAAWIRPGPALAA